MDNHAPTFATLGKAGSWMVAGRVVGFAFTLVLLATLGLGDYGLYATACAFAAIISAPLENVFVVRSVRVPLAAYERERSTRLLLGLVLVVLGAILYPVVLILGFALLVAGAEMAFNAYKSLPLREGRPAVVMRLDALRQIASIAMAGGYLLGAGSDANLAAALVFYLSPYAVVIVLSVGRCRGVRPAVPGGLRENVLLLGDAFVISLYLQGDIVLLGMIAGDRVVGAYAVASQIALALATLGQLYAQTFHERLRASGGDSRSGPQPRIVGGLAAFFTLGCVVVGTGMLVIGWQSEIGLVLVVMGVFAGLRTVDNAWTTVLYIQHRDGARIGNAAIALVIKLGLLVALVALALPGALAAAVAAVAAEVYLCVQYSKLSFRPVTIVPAREEEPA